MTTGNERQFQILALSGGGYRGLYTAKIIDSIEQDIGAPIASRFDLITGTSIGGILALAIALEIPAQKIVNLFVQHGEKIFKKRCSLRGMIRAPYSPKPLMDLLNSPTLFGKKRMDACKHPVIIPSLNYSTGQPVVFKTPHHSDFASDHRLQVVDVAMATSAAPAYFPRHVFNNNQYVDGGLYANAPGLLGLHEAMSFFDRDIRQIRMLSIGTLSSRFTANPKQNRDGGVRDWGNWNPLMMARRLFGISISAQEVLTNFMLGHRLQGRYLHVDVEIPASDERAQVIALDSANQSAREILLGAAENSFKQHIRKPEFQSFLEHSSSSPIFFHGENANTKGESQC